MNEEKLICLKAVVINSKKRGYLTEEDKALFKELLEEKGIDNFSIMSMAMMTDTHFKPKEYKGVSGLCFNYCVNEPLRTAELVKRRIVKDMAEFFEMVRIATLDILIGGEEK